ncbi:MAG TPA: fumarylacetoacetate hydrolase family protein [candidate division Zixibacteria bacterium]|nr:fumarylacetoacetate hydrolase family protein [candidate division Zixibacteria bacterium]
MKLVSFKIKSGEERVGLFVKGQTVDLADGAKKLSLSLPSEMNNFLEGGEKFMDIARKVESAFVEGKLDSSVSVKGATPVAPVPHPPSCRDGYAFRQHVATARRNRGADMIPEFDQYPVFYFTNHNAIFGEGDIVVESDHLKQLDFELEAAIVIGKPGKNISSNKADEYIAGFTIMNDFSARVLQMEEMKLNLGPAKGKDFATAIGPWLVTPDELEEFKSRADFGAKHNLRMTAVHNGKQISDGNLGDMNWTFAELIERASYGVELYPGDVIGSGTVGTGCYLELNGTKTLEAKQKGETHTPVWLQAGDTIELAITGLGKLTNKIVKANEDRSILAKKKMAVKA